MGNLNNNSGGTCKSVPPLLLSGIFVGCIAFAYLALKLYDEPLRRYLARRFLHHS